MNDKNTKSYDSVQFTQGGGGAARYDYLEELKPRIGVVGVGGGGGNAVNNMIRDGIQGIDFIVANTDAQALLHSTSETKIQLGTTGTRGLGAGANPSVGERAAEESAEEIKDIIKNYNMLFIATGMGGGTGTGASPVIARLAREMGILTVGVVTTPFLFEGIRRMKIAQAGIEALSENVDTLIVIPNQNLFRIATNQTTFLEAFKQADEVLSSGVRGITDLMTASGYINLDFNDVHTVMHKAGRAMMGTGEGEGENRARMAAESAVSNPLLEEIYLSGAKRVLINITGGTDMSLNEVDEVVNIIHGDMNADVLINFGAICDDNMKGKIRVSVVATDIDLDRQKSDTISTTSFAHVSTPNSQAQQSVPVQQGRSFNMAGAMPSNQPSQTSMSHVNIQHSFSQPSNNYDAQPRNVSMPTSSDNSGYGNRADAVNNVATPVESGKSMYDKIMGGVQQQSSTQDSYRSNSYDRDGYVETARLVDDNTSGTNNYQTNEQKGFLNQGVVDDTEEEFKIPSFFRRR